MTFGKLALRVTLGSLFIGHGTQKLFGWFGGHGLEGTAGFFENTIGLRPGKRHATAAGVAEAGGGALLVLGALTPLATAIITGTMVTAIRKVHAPNGPWVTEQGWEYNAVIIAALAALTESGPGSLSVSPHMKGPALAVAAVGAGVAGSYLATEVASDPAPAAEAGSSDNGATPDREEATAATA